MKVVSCFILALLVSFVLSLIKAQDQTGFISLDCGSPPDTSYNEVNTNISYISDSKYIDTGTSKQIKPVYKDSFDQPVWNVRSFPDGTRNCYTFNLTKGDEYFIRAGFIYGNYDGWDVAPSFELHLGPNLWDKVEIKDAKTSSLMEIMHHLKSSRLQICLVKTGTTIPFISTLELRKLINTSYNAATGSLQTYLRLDMGSNAHGNYRFAEDIYDRIWVPFTFPDWTNINTSLTVSIENNYKPPQIGMQRAIIPADDTKPINITFPSANASTQYYIFMHFAEIQTLKRTESREFNILYNGKPFYGPFSPAYLSVSTVYNSISLTPLDGNNEYLLQKTTGSTLPPLLNAMEIYTVNLLGQSDTDETEVEAMMNIKSTYRLNINSWQGDPCAPKDYVWNGLNCSYNQYDTPKITIFNLSSRGLTGEIAPYIFNLTHLKILDLSNNSLEGDVPEFLSGMTSLTLINFRDNKLNGSVPAALLERKKNGTLILSLEGNPLFCGSCSTVNKKKKTFIVPVVVSIASVFLLVAAFGTLLIFKKKNPKNRESEAGGVARVDPAKQGKQIGEDELRLVAANRLFKYSEVMKMTNKLERVLGRGGFGIVYHGNLGDTQVAVKILSQTSAQGYKEFKAEVELLMRVHHRNLTCLVGYCDEGDKLALIYEFMANGDLKEHLSGKRGTHILSWEGRLRIAVEAAQGLDYLHHGCKPPIVHRDIKPTNILLNEKFEAKIADFGLSRSFPLGGENYLATVVAGTPGYLDPEYYRTNLLAENSDVYSFGIVLLELITNRPVIDQTRERPHISEWVSLMLEGGDISKIVDPNLQGEYDTNSIWKVAEISIACVNSSPNKRPTMTTVVSELKDCLAEEIGRTQGSRVLDSSKDYSREVSLNLPLWL